MVSSIQVWHHLRSNIHHNLLLLGFDNNVTMSCCPFLQKSGQPLFPCQQQKAEGRISWDTCGRFNGPCTWFHKLATCPPRSVLSLRSRQHFAALCWWLVYWPEVFSGHSHCFLSKQTSDQISDLFRKTRRTRKHRDGTAVTCSYCKGWSKEPLCVHSVLYSVRESIRWLLHYTWFQHTSFWAWTS